MKQQLKASKLLSIKTLIYAVLLILFVVVVVTHKNELKAGLQALGHADPTWLAIAVISVLGTYCAAAFTYVILARVPLKYFRSVAVQVAASFVNRLLPSGVGGLGLNVDYLLKSGHKAAEATSVTAVNSAAAFASYVILLFLALTFSHMSPRSLLAGKSIPLWMIALIVGIVVIATIVLWFWKTIRAKITKLVTDSWANILAYRHQPFKVILAIAGAAMVTVFYVTVLYASAHAVGMPVTLVQAFVAYTIGTLVGVAVPTPGGLGGVEAGLYAGFIAFGFDASLCLSTIIIYRLMTFWLPILPGYLSFWLLQRKKYI